MSSIPKRLRQAIRLRRRAILKLVDVVDGFYSPRGVCVPRAVTTAKRVADLDRYIQRREWLRDPDFDPIAMGC